MGLSKAVKIRVLLGLMILLNTLPEASNNIGSGSACPTGCYSRSIDPVCGSDHQLYINACDFQAQNCRRNATSQVRVAPWSSCATFPCLNACTKEFDPVCGEDGHIASNPCTFFWYHVCEKKKPIRELPMNVCLKSKCPYNCNPQDTACQQAYNQCKFYYQFFG